MLEFKPVTLENIDWARSVVYKSGVRISEFAPGLMYGWQEAYNPGVCDWNGMMLSDINIGRHLYCWPVGEGNVTAALDAMKADAAEKGYPFKLCHVPEEAMPILKEYFRGEVKFTYDPGFSDYIYSAEKLVKLSGHRYHGKKNHVNRFKAEYDWSFEPITAANAGECLEMMEKWYDQTEEIRGFSDERRAITKCLKNIEAAGLDGGLLRTEAGVVAFTIGERMTEDTFVSHFEKAFYSVNGAYAAINQMFAQMVTEKYPELVYINREEDMGLEHIRKAKTSYHPEFLAHKFVAVPR